MNLDEKIDSLLRKEAMSVIERTVFRVNSHLAQHPEDNDAQRFISDYQICKWHGEASQEFVDALGTYSERYRIAPMPPRLLLTCAAAGLGLLCSTGVSVVGALTGSYLLVGFGTASLFYGLHRIGRSIKSARNYAHTHRNTILAVPNVLNNALKQLYKQERQNV